MQANSDDLRVAPGDALGLKEPVPTKSDDPRGAPGDALDPEEPVRSSSVDPRGATHADEVVKSTELTLTLFDPVQAGHSHTPRKPDREGP